jgi:hypothetical protein
LRCEPVLSIAKCHTRDGSKAGSMCKSVCVHAFLVSQLPHI